MYGPIGHVGQSWYGRMGLEQSGERMRANIADLRAKSTAEIMKLARTLDTTGRSADGAPPLMRVVDGG